ncbi:MAG: rRNA pseudouridine synthase [Candidatus Marinimicrobia bacterium]|nr:rRNA pseudouridine synthase [Candidatus Neomarinimicrobiota bacterium]
MTERVDKLFSRLGICSRREVLKLVRAGKITIEERSVKSAQERVDPSEIKFNGEVLDHPDRIATIFYKPEGVVCTRLGDDTIFQYFPSVWNKRRPLVNSAGRLDKDTTGILIITDDGDLVHRIISPRYHIPKTYEIEVADPFSGQEPEIFKSGTLQLADEDKPCKPADLEILTKNTGRLKLYEGRYHQVKKMFYHFNNEVVKLHRSTIGSLGLGDLKPGEWRDITPEDYRLIGV